MYHVSKGKNLAFWSERYKLELVMVRLPGLIR